jgi:hypothetical protein
MPYTSSKYSNIQSLYYLSKMIDLSLKRTRCGLLVKILPDHVHNFSIQAQITPSKVNKNTRSSPVKSHDRAYTAQFVSHDITQHDLGLTFGSIISSLQFLCHPELCAAGAGVFLQLLLICNDGTLAYQANPWRFSADTNRKIRGTGTAFRPTGVGGLDQSIFQRVE